MTHTEPDPTGQTVQCPMCNATGVMTSTDAYICPQNGDYEVSLSWARHQVEQAAEAIQRVRAERATGQMTTGWDAPDPTPDREPDPQGDAPLPIGTLAAFAVVKVVAVAAVFVAAVIAVG